MSSIQQIDAELTAEIKSILAEGLDQRFVAFKAECERRMRELSARAPAALTGFAPVTRSMPLLGGDQKFGEWLRGPRGQKAAYAASFADFRVETKAGPLLNVGGTQHVGAGVAGPAQPALRLVELIPAIPLMMGSSAEYTKETAFTAGAAIVAEGTLKPDTVVTVANVLATIVTIATVLRVSIQSLSDTPGLYGWLDSRLRYSVQLAAENHLLNAALPDGLLANAGALSAAFDPGATGTPLDLIAAAISQLAGQGFVADGVVLNAADANKARLVKSSTGEYLWASPDSNVGTTAMWGVPAIISPSIAPGTWLVGAFAQSCLLFSRQVLTVEVSFEDQDNFVKNLATVRAEERLGSAVPVPAGLITGTFPAGLPLAAKK